MQRFHAMAVFLGLGLGCAAQGAWADVPAANVPDPKSDVIEVLAVWQQILPDSAGVRSANGQLPGLELRFALSLPPGVAVTDACGPDHVSVEGVMTGQEAALRAHSAGRRSDGSIYDVAICAATLDPDARMSGVLLSGVYAPMYASAATLPQMPGPALFGQNSSGGRDISAVFLSDTGCRGPDPDQSDARMKQDCTVPLIDGSGAVTNLGWPLLYNIDGAIAAAPDFTIFGGDYHYFYEDHHSYFSGIKDMRFDYWLQEILLPARALMLSMPVVFARGNHEQCSPDYWFGEGWLALFSASDVTQCNNGGSWTESWSFAVAPANDTAVAPVTVWMVDSADPRHALSNGAYDAPASGGRDKIWVTHYPPAKTEYYSYGTTHRHLADDDNANAASTALKAACRDTADCWPRIVLSGHQHLFQHLALSAPGLANEGVLTDVYLAGHGGVKFDQDFFPGFNWQTSGMRVCATSFAGLNDRGQEIVVMGRTDIEAQVSTSSKYGFLHLRRDAATAAAQGPASGWEVSLRWFDGLAPDVTTATSCLYGNAAVPLSPAGN